MRISIEDRILKITGEWIHTNAIVLHKDIRGDKTAIIRTLHKLAKSEDLETKKERNKILYKRRDTARSDEDFQYAFTNVTQRNNNEFLKAIKNIPELSTKKNKLSRRAKEILHHLESLLDLIMIVRIRMSFQMNLGIISEITAQKRIKMYEDEMNEVMEKITTKYNKDLKLIQEYFQDHNKELTFKI